MTGDIIFYHERQPAVHRKLSGENPVDPTFSLRNTFKSCKSVSKRGLLKVLKVECMVFFTFWGG
jgi:hypothetical protein